MADQEVVGPLTPVERMAIEHEGKRIDGELRRLGTVLEGLKRSRENTEREIAALNDRRTMILREILKGRGKDPGARPMKEQVLPDGSIRILVG